MRLFPLLALAILALLFLWWFQRTPPQQVTRVLRRTLLWLGAGLLILLTASGRLHWLFALLGALAPFVQRLLRLLQLMPLLQRLHAMFHTARAANGTTAGSASEIRTRFLLMRLDHDSGALTGEVLEGRFRGRRLDQLDLGELQALLQECHADAQSAAVLKTYLEREHGGDWDADASPGGETEAGAFAAEMTEEEAYRILGLEPGADDQVIRAAHRRLMQKLHPDHGGSTYLAAKINQAKALLLGS